MTTRREQNNNPLHRLLVKRGSDLPQSKLTEDDVRLIRSAIEVRENHKLQAKMLANRELAKKFNVHVRTIDRIGTGECWTHV